MPTNGCQRNKKISRFQGGRRATKGIEDNLTKLKSQIIKIMDQQRILMKTEERHGA